MKIGMKVSSFVALLALIALGAAPASAQNAKPQASGGSVGVLGQVQVAALPSPSAEVWFIRFFLDPGGSLPLDKQIGPTVIVVESGALTVTTNQPVEVSGSNIATPVTTAGMHETMATAGQTVYVHEDTSLALRNNGGQRVAFLGLLTFSGEREVEAAGAEEGAEAAGTPPAQPVGFSQQPLGVTQAQFPQGPGTITIERIALKAGVNARTDLTNGAMTGGVEHGSATINLDSGTCFIWPSMMSQVFGASGGQSAPENKRIVSGQSADLAGNDAFGCFGGVVTWSAGADGATVLRAVILPASAATPVATPAAIRMLRR